MDDSARTAHLGTRQAVTIGAAGAAALDLLPDGALVADDSGVVVALNAAGARILGGLAGAGARGASGAVGRDYRQVLPLVDAADRDWWGCTDPYGGLRTRTGQPERELTLPDGRALLVTARYLRACPGGSLTRLVVSFRRADHRARAERNGADLISTVAHELRSPLTSVKGFTATLLAKWDRFTDEQRRLMLETVDADADRVTRLISELLDVSRIDAGRLEVHRQVVDVPAAVWHAVRGRVAAGDAEDRFAVEVAAGLPETWLDPDKLNQILGNLLDNAVRHGAGTVTVTIAPWPRGEGDGVVVSVCDEGPGVPDELAKVVFRRFWRHGRRGGTGLGLHIVKGLTEAHGGAVTLSRAPGGGACFEVRLPAGSEPAAELFAEDEA